MSLPELDAIARRRGGLKGRQRGVLEQCDACADVLERIEVEGRHGVVVGDQRVAGDTLQLSEAGLIRQRCGCDLQVAQHLHVQLPIVE